MSTPANRFQFGNQLITTRVFVMSPRGPVTLAAPLDVTAPLADRVGGDPFAHVGL